MNYYEQPCVSAHLIKLASEVPIGALIGAGLGGAAGYHLGALDKKSKETRVLGALAGLLLGGALGGGAQHLMTRNNGVSWSDMNDLFGIKTDSVLDIPHDTTLAL